ncbi:MAG: methyltransferase domain-containing protein [Proteobacteria bacterium]|nr:methyltransferase domain-containing protein [Pseudomonadota bacterium]
MLRQQLIDHYGDGCRLRAFQRAPGFGAHLYVVDVTRRTRPVRVLGSFDSKGVLVEQSAMDRLRPERLAFGYERLMLLACTMVPEPKSVLLLGLGGGAMWRHLDAYLPDCAVTIVERDPLVRALARRFFHVKRPVVMADAEHVVAESRGQFDVVMVDLYDSRGATAKGGRFWRACLRALKPHGCLAVNWADFAGATTAGGEAARLADVAERAFFIGERIRNPNVIQYAPTWRAFRRSQLSTRLRRFAEAHCLPREDRDVLKRCRLLTRYEDAEDEVDD